MKCMATTGKPPRKQKGNQKRNDIKNPHRLGQNEKSTRIHNGASPPHRTGSCFSGFRALHSGRCKGGCDERHPFPRGPFSYGSYTLHPSNFSFPFVQYSRQPPGVVRNIIAHQHHRFFGLHDTRGAVVGKHLNRACLALLSPCTGVLSWVRVFDNKANRPSLFCASRVFEPVCWPADAWRAGLEGLEALRKGRAV